MSSPEPSLRLSPLSASCSARLPLEPDGTEKRPLRPVLWISRGLMMLSLFVSAWWMAGYFSTGRFATLAIVALAIGASLLDARLYASLRFGVSRTLLIASLAILFGAAQLVPLGRFLDVVSPGVVETRKEFTSSGSSVAETISEQGAAAAPTYLTLARWETKTALSTLTMGLAGLTLGWLLVRDDRSRLLLLVGFALCGASLVFWGIVQQLAHPDQIVWGHDNPGHSIPFSTFLNRNHAADFLGMSLGCAFGLMVWSHGRWSRKLGHSGAAKCFTAHASWLLKPSVLAVGLMFGWLALGMLLTLSRGGWLAIVIAVVGVAVACRRSMSGGGRESESRSADRSRGPKSSGRRSPGGQNPAGRRSNRRRSPNRSGAPARPTGLFLPLVVTTCLLTAIGFFLTHSGLADRVEQRLEKLGFSAMASDARFDHWMQALPAAAHYLPLGSGLGTYGYAHLPFTQSSEGTWYSHAHNQYLEVLVETGVPGVVILFAFMILFAHSMRGILGIRNDSGRRAIGVAAWVAFAMQSIHAICEFGLIMPANMLGLSILMGAGLAAAPSPQPEQNENARRRPSSATPTRMRFDSNENRFAFTLSHPKGLAVASYLYVMVIGVFVSVALVHLGNRVTVEHELARSEFTDLTPAPSVQLTRCRIDSVTQLIERFPDAQRPRLRLARLRTHLARRVSYDELMHEAASQQINIDSRDLWQSVGLDNAIYVLHQHDDSNSDAEIDDVRTELAERLALDAELGQAKAELVELLAINPMRPKAHLLLARVAAATGHQWEHHFRRLQQLSSGDPQTSFAIGLLSMSSGDHESMLRHWKQTIEFDPRLLETIVRVTRQRVPDQEVANRLMPAKWDVPYRLSLKTKQNEADAHFRELLLRRASQLIDQSELGPLDRIRAHYQVANERGDYPAAAEWLLKAVQLEPHDPNLRYQAANALVKSERLEEAETQIRVGSGLAPGEQRYKRLLSSLQRRDN